MCGDQSQKETGEREVVLDSSGFSFMTTVVLSHARGRPGLKDSVVSTPRTHAEREPVGRSVPAYGRSSEAKHAVGMAWHGIGRHGRNM